MRATREVVGGGCGRVPLRDRLSESTGGGGRTGSLGLRLRLELSALDRRTRRRRLAAVALCHSLRLRLVVPVFEALLCDRPARQEVGLRLLRLADRLPAGRQCVVVVVAEVAELLIVLCVGQRPSRRRGTALIRRRPRGPVAIVAPRRALLVDRRLRLSPRRLRRVACRLRELSDQLRDVWRHRSRGRPASAPRRRRRRHEHVAVRRLLVGAAWRSGRRNPRAVLRVLAVGRAHEKSFGRLVSGLWWPRRVGRGGLGFGPDEERSGRLGR